MNKISAQFLKIFRFLKFWKPEISDEPIIEKILIKDIKRVRDIFQKIGLGYKDSVTILEYWKGLSKMAIEKINSPANLKLLITIIPKTFDRQLEIELARKIYKI